MTGVRIEPQFISGANLDVVPLGNDGVVQWPPTRDRVTSQLLDLLTAFFNQGAKCLTVVVGKSSEQFREINWKRVFPLTRYCTKRPILPDERPLVRSSILQVYRIQELPNTTVNDVLTGREVSPRWSRAWRGKA